VEGHGAVDGTLRRPAGGLRGVHAVRLMLDSHTLLWSADQPARIPALAMTAMSDPAAELLVSAATLWEIAIKFGMGRLPLSLHYRPWMDKAFVDLDLTLLPISLDH